MELSERVVDGGVDRHALPIRQQVDADEVNVIGEFGVSEPYVPRLGGAHWLTDRVAGAIEIGREFLDLQIASEDDLVSDDHTSDVRVSPRELYRRCACRTCRSSAG